MLIYIRDVRNALQHPKHRSDGHAVQISEAFLDEVQALLSHLRNPPTASSVGVPRKEIKTAGLTDQLGDLADEMKQCGFSHVPILDERDAVIGSVLDAWMLVPGWVKALDWSAIQARVKRLQMHIAKAVREPRYLRDG